MHGMKRVMLAVSMIAGMTVAPGLRADEKGAQILAPIAELAPGAAVIYHDGGAQGMAVAGERARGSGVSVAPGDLWHIGSNTKAMTATLVARLAEAGVVSLNDTVGAVLGAQLPDLHPDYQAITYAELLSHRAGIAANASIPQLLRLRCTDAERDAPADRLTVIAPMLSKPRKGECVSLFQRRLSGGRRDDRGHDR